MAPSQLRVESAANDGNGGGSGSSLSGTLASNVQTTPPKPLLNRCLGNCKIIDLGAVGVGDWGPLFWDIMLEEGRDECDVCLMY